MDQQNLTCDWKLLRIGFYSSLDTLLINAIQNLWDIASSNFKLLLQPLFLIITLPLL